MIEDYNIYDYTKKEWMKFFIQGALIGAGIGFLFYNSILGILALMTYGFFYVRNKKKELVEARKWKLNLEFRDGLASVSAALNAGYSTENALAQAVEDLKLMYSSDALIVNEFEGMVHQISMNQTLEEVLMNFAQRTKIDDMMNFAEVFATAKRTGGDLMKIIKTTGNTIADKIEVKREIITLITAKKLECNIMNMIPFGIILYLRMTSPGFLSPLYNNLFGVIFMTILLILYYFVGLLSKKIIRIDL